MNNSTPELESVAPQPEEFVRSIAEQGYRLETAIADLIDNSVSANADRIEVLLDTTRSPFTLYIADNGNGMNEDCLREAMRFPSSSMTDTRRRDDLGRFGLGLKTASFSQSRHFSVISRFGRHEPFHGRTWDLELLREHGWMLKVESPEDIDKALKKYRATSECLLGSFDESFEANTVVIWQGLYKFENYISERDAADVLKQELTEVTKGYLSIVFHRFLERKEKPVRIRLNNTHVEPFDPFPKNATGIRHLSQKNRSLGSDVLQVDGFVLPTGCIDSVKQGSSIWVPQGKSLTDMEGIYLYRADRIILFGGWLNLAGRSPRMQLARMRIEIGNSADHFLHLNIAKSQVEMPYDLRAGLREYVSSLRAEAEREYLNRTVRPFSGARAKKLQPFVTTSATNRGAQMSINTEFPVVKSLFDTLNKDQKLHLRTILKMVEKELNSIRRVHEDENFTGNVENDGLTKSELIALVTTLLDQDFSAEFIKSNVFGQLGFNEESLPEEVRKLLNEKA